MPEIIIDGKQIEVEDGLTLIQACEEAGVEIPRFCYHERLSIAGNCRMCLVEVVGMPKPMASCALGVNDLRRGPNGELPEIRTNTPTVKKAREGVMEFLLINHPLDCPICDQGGECDLQDQAMAFGIDSNRYAENKRAVEDKHIGPLIKTIMTRCIHCTRCVRFMTEIAGVEELGLIGRGENAEITTYLERGITSELSGNVIDLCPVGALTSKPFAFTARPWELRKTETIDVMDALGSNIRVDARGTEVMRILPRNNDAINEEWISDKSRFIWDGLKTQRLDRPYLRDENGKFRPASWDEALAVVAKRLRDTQADKIAAISGDLCAAEEVYALKMLLDRLGIKNRDCRSDGTKLSDQYGRAGYLFNSTIEGIEQADSILLIGCNPRHEAAVMNARIRQVWRHSDLQIGLIGEPVDLTYDYHYLGAGPETLEEVAKGANPFADILRRASHPMVIVGQGALTRADGAAVWSAVARLAAELGIIRPDWNGFNVLHTAAGRVGALDLGFLPVEGGLDRDGILAAAETGEVEVVYLLGADEFDPAPLAKAFVIYQGTHGDVGAQHADVILPGAAYTEKNGTYVNTEGRVQFANRAAFAPGQAREDWAIIRALSGVMEQPLPFDNETALRAAMITAFPHLGQQDEIAPSEATGLTALAKAGGRLDKAPFKQAHPDFYLTNPIARASRVMAQMSALKQEELKRKNNDKEATGTDG